MVQMLLAATDYNGIDVFYGMLIGIVIGCLAGALGTIWWLKFKAPK